MRSNIFFKKANGISKNWAISKKQSENSNYSILDGLIMSIMNWTLFISIKFPLHKQSVNSRMCFYIIVRHVNARDFTVMKLFCKWSLDLPVIGCAPIAIQRDATLFFNLIIESINDLLYLVQITSSNMTWWVGSISYCFKKSSTGSIPNWNGVSFTTPERNSFCSIRVNGNKFEFWSMPFGLWMK